MSLDALRSARRAPAESGFHGLEVIEKRASRCREARATIAV